MDERDLPHRPRICTRRLTIPPLSEKAKASLIQHGCSFEDNELILPEGTTEAETLPRVSAARYRLKFPDGYEIGERLERNGTSSLYLPINELQKASS